MYNENLIEENFQEEEEDIQKYQIHSHEDLTWDTMNDNLTCHDHISQTNKFDNEREDWYSYTSDEEQIGFESMKDEQYSSKPIEENYSQPKLSQLSCQEKNECDKSLSPSILPLNQEEKLPNLQYFEK